MLTIAKILSGLLLMVISAQVFAGACSPAGGVKRYEFNYTPSLTSPDDNRPGLTLPPHDWNASGGAYSMHCLCNTDTYYNVFYTAKSNLPVGSPGYYIVLDQYLEAATEIYVKGGLQANKAVPFTNLSNQYSQAPGAVPLRCNSDVTGFETGSRGTITLRFLKAFVGVREIPVVELARIYAATDNQVPENNSSLVSVVTMRGRVTVVQGCDLQGNQLNVDFGSLHASKFNRQGQKPDGFTPRSYSLTFNCNNIDSGATLELYFEARNDSHYPNAIATNNSNIGVVIENEQGTIMKPNQDRMPINFDYPSQVASTTIKTYPVSTTGVTPATGPFSATATLKIDIQ